MVKKTESQAVIVNQPTQLIPSRVLMLTNLVSLQQFLQDSNDRLRMEVVQEAMLYGNVV